MRLVDRNNRNAGCAWRARTSPASKKKRRPGVEILLGRMTDPFNPCCYPLNPYPRVVSGAFRAVVRRGESGWNTLDADAASGCESTRCPGAKDERPNP